MQGIASHVGDAPKTVCIHRDQRRDELPFATQWDSTATPALLEGIDITDKIEKERRGVFEAEWNSGKELRAEGCPECGAEDSSLTQKGRCRYRKVESSDGVGCPGLSRVLLCQRGSDQSPGRVLIGKVPVRKVFVGKDGSRFFSASNFLSDLGDVQAGSASTGVEGRPTCCGGSSLPTAQRLMHSASLCVSRPQSWRSGADVAPRWLWWGMPRNLRSAA